MLNRSHRVEEGCGLPARQTVDQENWRNRSAEPARSTGTSVQRWIESENVKHQPTLGYRRVKESVLVLYLVLPSLSPWVSLWELGSVVVSESESESGLGLAKQIH